MALRVSGKHIQFSFDFTGVNFDFAYYRRVCQFVFSGGWFAVCDSAFVFGGGG